MKPKVITILGPTASGKTALSVRLAKALGSVVISGDAFQVYRGMDIGTAKVTKEEAEGVPHFLVDCLDPGETYSAARFCEMAGDIIRKENAAGRTPILAGGTGLYIQSLLEGYEFLPKGKGQKSIWQEFYRMHGSEGLAEEIWRRAPDAEIPPDPQRRIRMLEVMDVEGKPKEAGKSRELVFDGPVIGLSMDRAELYRRIDLRVELMVKVGLLGEVERLLAEGVPETAQSMRGIGYKEMIPVVKGEESLSEAVRLIQKNTRHFAKRQITWYKRMPYIHWFSVDGSHGGLDYNMIQLYVISHLINERNADDLIGNHQ